MEIFFEVHKDLPREGPGDSASTERAFRMMEQLPQHVNILDVGCGPGQQTFDLAALSQGQIYAVDTHQPFMDKLNARAKTNGLSERIQTYNVSMDAMEFPPASFDVIWSEGAIYIKGFENGLRYWKKFLKSGGYIAVTEATWLKDNPPQEVKDFWNEAYPDMISVEDNISIIQRLGYRVVNHFVLPESSWRVNYYGPMEKRIAMLREKYHDNAEVIAQLDEEALEIDIYNKYSDWYGYVFYIMQVSS